LVFYAHYSKVQGRKEQVESTKSWQSVQVKQRIPHVAG
jgi:hypothetical protein